jgi:prephenate dehydrogenase
MTFRRLVVFGVGLIGGSAALALRRAGEVGEVVGIGRSPANLADARRLGICDRVAALDQDWSAEVAGADLVLVATPVAQFPSLFGLLASRLPAGAVVTDAGSTKQDVVAAAREHLAGALPRFVAAHPIAGSERSGAQAADASLFDDREVILTPTEVTAADAVTRARRMWEACGARVFTMEAKAHDRVFAAVSHLPHLVAAAYLDGVAARGNADELFARAGSGFRDFTRIAAAAPETWRDIALANREALVEELALLQAALNQVAGALQHADGNAIAALFERSRKGRERWARAKDGG